MGGTQGQQRYVVLWFIWERSYRGDAVVRLRVSWERPELPSAVLGKRGRPRKGFEKPANVRLSTYGNSCAYILARLERDGHTELAKMVRTGQLSARATARA